MATSTSADTINGKPVEKVGVIFVHGIGEQRRFQHLEAETRQIVDAIIANFGTVRRDVTITLSTGAGDAYRGEQSSWVSGREAPLHAFVELDTQIVDIAFHEVWWADVNETLTLGKQLRFWLWGLSIAGIVENNMVALPGAIAHTRPAIPGFRLNIWHRVRLAFVAGLFFISAFSIAWINLLLKRLNFGPLLSTETIVNYLSAVKLYTQTKRAGGSPMDGPDEPPRAAIRRRMVRAIFDVATGGYDRWYILAHSLGSVVAFNGIMEPEDALPNYLERDRWQEIQLIPGLTRRGAAPVNGNAMMPVRPLWLDDYDVVDRKVLFETFRGLLTYGAPLERFGGLWGATVPINTDEAVFRQGTEWINVYDPTDPVGTWLSHFDPDPTVAPPPGYTTLQPESYPCRASPILLLSHISYLSASRRRSLRLIGDAPHLLVNQLSDWLVRGGSLASRIDSTPKGYFTFWMWRDPRTTAEPPREGSLVWPRRVGRFIQWVVIGLLLSALALWMLHFLWGQRGMLQSLWNWLGTLLHG